MQAKQALAPIQSSFMGPLASGLVQGGHYRVVGSTSAIAPSANAALCDVQWKPTATAGNVTLMIVTRISVTVAVATAVTAQRVDPLVGVVLRSYTGINSTNASALTLTTNNAKMRTAFPTTQFGTTGQIALASAAAGISGGTSTADANSFGIAGIDATQLVAVGTGTPTFDLYRHDVHQGEYPLILASQEGFQVKWGPTALATGTVVVSVGIDWVEALNY